MQASQAQQIQRSVCTATAMFATQGSKLHACVFSERIVLRMLMTPEHSLYLSTRPQ